MKKLDIANRNIENNMVQIASLEETNSLFQWLQGEPMEGYTFEHQPKLTPEEAFAVIYMLQEGIGIIPNTYEMCNGCKTIYDSEEEGVVINENSEILIESDDPEKEDIWKKAEFPKEIYGCYCNACRPPETL